MTYTGECYQYSNGVIKKNCCGSVLMYLSGKDRIQIENELSEVLANEILFDDNDADQTERNDNYSYEERIDMVLRTYDNQFSSRSV